MGNFIALCHQQHTQRNRIASNEFCTRRSQHLVFAFMWRATADWTPASPDLTRGWTHMFAGDKGVIYSWENSCLVGGRMLWSFRAHPQFATPSNEISCSGHFHFTPVLNIYINIYITKYIHNYIYTVCVQTHIYCIYCTYIHIYIYT